MPTCRVIAFFLIAPTALVWLAGCGTSLASPPDGNGQRSTAALARQPVVVELFQSQGCSSCPPANAHLNTIADRADILALSFAVTYWDRLGWKDTFASPGFTNRQQDYAAAGRGQVATPEFIVNGTYAVVGSNRAALEAAIAKAGGAIGGPKIAMEGSGIRVGKAPVGKAATVWLVRYDPRSRDVPIRAGENGGRTLPHRNIVRELIKLGTWSGPAVALKIPSPPERGLKTAVLIQRGAGGPILSAHKI